jgi:DNA-binding transcriptional LysR family regulator
MEFTLRQLAYVAAAAEHGNFSIAARHMAVSQSSISTTIAFIEQQLGVRLFERHASRGVTTTPFGESFLREAMSLLSHATRFSSQVKHLHLEPSGDLVIGALSSLATDFLSELLDDFLRAHPTVVVEVREQLDHESLVAALLDGRFEYALTVGQLDDARARSFEIASLAPHAIVSAHHPLAERQVARLADCVVEPFLLPTGGDARKYVSELFAALDLKPRIVFRAGSTQLLRAMASRGLGFAIETRSLCAGASLDGLPLVALPFAEPLPRLRVISVCAAGKALSPAASAFDRRLRARVG